MKLNIKKLLALTGLGSLVLFTAAFAGGRCRFADPERRAEFVVDRISDELDLNDTQKSKLDDIKKEVLAARKAHSEDRKGMVKQVIALIESDQWDAKAAESLIAKKRALVDQVSPKVLAKVAEFHAALTPEQRKK